MERKLATSLWFWSERAFDAFSFPVSVPELYERHHPATPDYGICTCTVFLRLHLRSLSRYTPWLWHHPQLKWGRVPHRHIILRQTSLCHIASSSPSRVRLETHTSPFPRATHPCVYLGSAGKPLKPRHLVGIHERCPSTMEQSRGAQGTFKQDNRGIVAVFLPQDGAQCRLQSISRKLDKYSSISLPLMSILLLLDCYQCPCWRLKKPRLGRAESHCTINMPSGR